MGEGSSRESLSRQAETADTGAARDAASGDFAALVEGHRRAGQYREAERLARSGLADRPDCAEGVLALALLLLEQDRGDEARTAIEQWARIALPTPTVAGALAESLPIEVSDRELELAFEAAETDRDQVIDADVIAQRAMADLAARDPFEAEDSSFHTRTVAGLLEQQGDPSEASRIRAIVDSADEGAPRARDERSSVMAELERWLVNLRGGVQ